MSRKDSSSKSVKMIQLVVGVGVGIALLCSKQNNQLRARDNESEPQQSQNSPNPNRPPTIYNTGSCPICFGRIKRGERLSSILKCGHVYHNNCLGELIKREHRQCPECRKDIELYNP